MTFGMWLHLICGTGQLLKQTLKSMNKFEKLVNWAWQTITFIDWLDDWLIGRIWSLKNGEMKNKKSTNIFLFTDAEDANKVLQIKQYMFYLFWNCGD